MPELEAWYKGVTEALEQQFGNESTETSLWRDGLERIRKESWEGVGRVAPYGGHWVIHNLVESLGLLAQIRVLQIGLKQATTSVLPFSSLHPRVAESSGALFAAGEYDAALFAAFRAVEEVIRHRGGAAATDVGVALVSSVMNPKAPRLQFSNIAAEQEAYHSLFRGALGAFKNPLSHRSVGHTDAVRVFELLALASLLIRALDDLSEVH